MVQTHFRIGVIVLVLVLSGCETPQAIRHQSTVGAAQIGLITAELKRLAAEEKRLLGDRARRVISLHAIVGEVEERRTKRLTGKSEIFFNTVFKKVDETEKRWASARAKEAEIRKKVEGSVMTFSVPVKPLAEAQQLLANLGEETKRKAQLKFLWSFVKATSKDFNEKRKQSDKKVAEATKLAGAQAIKIEETLLKE